MTLPLRELRRHLRPFRRRSLSAAIAHFSVAWTIYGCTVYAAAVAPHVPLRILAALVAGVFSSNLFMIGHDACHGSFTRVRWLNRVAGRIAFLPSLQPYSLWELTHNRIHHVHTNLKGKDFVWTPLSKPEFDALSWWRRALYRTCRTPLGLALYYPLELWWPRLILPRREHLDRKRAAYDLDRLLVLLFACLQAFAVVCCSGGTLGDRAAAAVFGVLIPYLVFSWMIGFVIYFNHTHLDVPWFDREEEWRASRSAIEMTTRLKFPRWTSFFASSIMDHVAHHVDPLIPLVRLGEAQGRIEELLPGRVLVQEWSVKELLLILRRCKLYDYDSGCWLDYDGLPTTKSHGRRGPPRASPAWSETQPRQEKSWPTHSEWQS